MANGHVIFHRRGDGWQGWLDGETLRFRQDQPIEGLPSSLLAFVIHNEHAAGRFRDIVQAKLDAGINVGRRPISSVLSEGRYHAEVHRGYPPAYYPERTPHYE
jgi:hypothetical protein